MPLTAFQPMGNTCLIAATSSTASTPTQVSTGAQPGMLVANTSTGTQAVYVVTGQTSAIQAACPTTTLPCPGLCIPAQTARVLSVPPGQWISAATSGGAINVFATPGAYGS